MNSSATRWSRRFWWFLAASALMQAMSPAAQPYRDSHQSLAAPRSPFPSFFFTDQQGLAIHGPSVSARLDESRIRYQAGGGEVSLVFPGSYSVRPRPAATTGGRVSFLLGSDEHSWQRDLSLSRGAVYPQIYPGIDLVLVGEGVLVKSEFHVAPGADPNRIRMRYDGATGMAVDPSGALLVATPYGTLRDDAPVLYQLEGTTRREVAGAFVVLDSRTAAFRIGGYDRSLPLVIDPVISFSSYLGGSGIDHATSVAVDNSGNTYIAGWTDSTDLPLQGPIASYRGSVDAFVVKLDPSGTTVLYATYIGGSGDDRALSVGVNSTGNAYIAGYTASTNFPLASALQTALGGGRDAFVTKLNAAGSALMYSTYWGGGRNDVANSIAVDSFGQAYVGGETESSNFPLRFPYQATYRGAKDGFLFKINLNNALTFSTYLGGTGEDRVMAVAVSTGLTPYVTGCTTSSNFPTRNPQQPSRSGGQDAFVTRFDGDAANLVYSTYLGGSGGGTGRTECGYAITTDAFSNAYLAGVTSSTNFPIISAFQSSRGGGTTDGFITKLSSDGFRIYSSYFGGRSIDAVTSIAVDSARQAYVGGYTASGDFPLVTPVQTSFGGLYDAFLAKISVAGNALLSSTYYGGSSSDTLSGLRFYNQGVMAVGLTSSSDITLASPFQNSRNGVADGWVIRLGSF